MERYQPFWEYLWKIPKGLNKPFDDVMDQIELLIETTSGQNIESYVDIIVIKAQRSQVRLLLDIAGYVVHNTTVSDEIQKKLTESYFLACLGDSLYESMVQSQALGLDNPLFDEIMSKNLSLQLAVTEVECEKFRDEIDKMYNE
jgi:hypothetical protein